MSWWWTKNRREYEREKRNAEEALETFSSRLAKWAREANQNAERFAAQLEHEVTGEWRVPPDDPAARR